MRLMQREKLLVIAVVISAVLWMLFRFGVKPALARIETLNRVIPERQRELTELRAKSKQYISLRDSLSDLRKHVASQDQALELLPFLESLTEECGLAQNATAMDRNVLQLDKDYQETIVEIRLQNVTLMQLVDFLSKIEDSSRLLAKTKSLHIRRSTTNADLLDSIIEIHSPQLAQSAVTRR
jgi:type II secretory pathway component PulM